MAIRLDDYLAGLPPEERTTIAARTAELLEEVSTLRELREAREHSQAQIAERLGIQQAAVSKLERRADLYISTLRGYINAMGGELKITATFPDHRPVEIKQFTSI